MQTKWTQSAQKINHSSQFSEQTRGVGAQKEKEAQKVSQMLCTLHSVHMPGVLHSVNSRTCGWWGGRLGTVGVDWTDTRDNASALRHNTQFTVCTKMLEIYNGLGRHMRQCSDRGGGMRRHTASPQCTGSFHRTAACVQESYFICDDFHLHKCDDIHISYICWLYHNIEI